MQIDSHIDNHQAHSNLYLNIILIVYVGLFDLIQSLSADIFYVWLFRTLSVISLLIIIYINGNKALEIFKKKKDDRIEKKKKGN